MATYNNKHWLLSHIRNSFISTDDTGLCEAIMLSEDMPTSMLLLHHHHHHGKGNAPKHEAQQQQQAAPTQLSTNQTTTTTTTITTSTATRQVNNNTTNGYDDDEDDDASSRCASVDRDYACYPGLDQSDDEETYPLAQSYDVQMDQGMGFIQRSNTAQKLDKMDMARKRAAQIKNVKCPDQASLVPASQQDANNGFFVRKPVPAAAHPKGVIAGQSLSELLEQNPKQPLNKYLPYARFDGTGQLTAFTKKIRIFLTMLPECHRNYPVSVCVLGTAKIQEFIGLICYRTSLDHPDVPLRSVRNYGLYITEEDGEVDDDFPPLDINEPCSKFCFSHLALVERTTLDVRSVAHTMSIASESEAPQESLADDQQSDIKHQSDANALMLGHTTKMEAPIYRSYQLQISRRSFFKTDIQLGISSEKLEIDPVQQQNSKFWSHQKAISHSMDSVVWCDITEEPSPSRALIKIVYCPTLPLQDGAQLLPQSSPSAGSISSNSHHHIQFPANVYRSYRFVTDAATAQEIVDKVRNIIEVRSSPARRDYLSRRASSSSRQVVVGVSGQSVAASSEKKKKPFKKLFT